MFKKILKWLGIVLLVIIGLFVLIAVYSGYQQSKYEKTAIPYIKEIVPLISKWNPKEIKPYFTSEALANVSDEDLEKMFKWLSKLGELKSFEEPQFLNIFSGTSIQSGSHTIITYHVLAKYESGDANINLRLIATETSFALYHFNINSKALIE